MNYWLFKSEPNCFSIDDLAKKPEQITPWDGVRNYQARNFMRSMNIGDLGFFYHSSCAIPGIVGIIKVVKQSYPEEADPRWEHVDVQLVETFPNIITLEKLRAIPKLHNMVILRKGNRLSITPLTEQEWETIHASANH
ncbi:MAG: EVE domain-containing protein [Gammaproteobacteria bacterium]|nr:EVE domain-containing protein [Gammaproteobacteria bacterium]